jgi:hypothetical protein
VPTDPAIVYAAGLLLGAMTADALGGRHDGIAPAGAVLLKGALSGRRADAVALASLCRAHVAMPPAGRGEIATQAVVLGFAETATALGHTVAEALGADYLHSTRRRPSGVEELGRFEEEHSHAAEHLLLPEDPEILRRPGPLVLVDDELSTGQTALNTIAALHDSSPRARYVIATLVDLRSAADRLRMTEVSHRLGAAIDVVSLAAGTVVLPDDVLSMGTRLIAANDTPPSTASGQRPSRRVPAVDWDGVRESGRHGFDDADRAALHRAAARLADQLVPDIAGDRVLVLGFEELMYAPLIVAREVGDRLGEAATVRSSTTTRSPVLAVDDPAYAIRTALSFPSHDDPADGPGPRFAYNVAPGADDTRRFTDIVFVADDAGDTAALHAPGGLLDQLSACCDRVHLLTLPTHRPVAVAGSAR